MSKKINIPKKILYPPDDILNPTNQNPNFKYIILWMLAKNDACQWAHFKDIISPSTLSGYIRFLIDNDYIEKFKIGHYKITKKGREYFNELSNYKVKVNKSPKKLMEQAKILEQLDQISAQQVEKFTSVEDSLHAVRNFLESIESFQVLVDVFKAQYARKEMKSSEIVRTALALHLLRAHYYEGQELVLEVLEKEKATCFYFHVLEFLNTANGGCGIFRDLFLGSLEQHYGILREELGFFLDFDYMRYVEYKHREHRSKTLLQELNGEKGKKHVPGLHEQIIHSEYINISDPVKREQSPSDCIQITLTNGELSPLKSLGLSGWLVFFEFSIEHYEKAYLKGLPESFRTLHHIEQLGLVDFDFTEFPLFYTLRGFTSLKSLGLSNITFQSIPKSLSFLPSLESIYFHNQVDILPPWVAQFACQEKFCRKYVERGVHPDDAPVLSLLEHLWCIKELERYDANFRGGDPQYSPTYDLNEEGYVISIMKSGEHLPLRTFPPKLCTLAHIERLTLYNEEIEYLPDCVTQMTNLTSICLDENPIKRIPDIRSLPDAWVKHLSSIVPELVAQQKK